MNNNEKERSEKFMREFVEKQITLEEIKQLFQDNNNHVMILACLELIDKYIINNSNCNLHKRLPPNFNNNFSDLNPGKYSYLKEAPTTNTKKQNNVLSYLLEFFIKYVCDYCSQSEYNSNKIIFPNFLFNSFANLISVLFKKQLSLGLFKPEYFIILKERFFESSNDNHLLVKMGLKIFNFLLDNILIDSENLGYFNFRKLINIFQNNLIFNMMNITRRISKYFLASSLALESLLLVNNTQINDPSMQNGQIFDVPYCLFNEVATKSNPNKIV